MVKLIETVAGVLLILGLAYVGWRWLLLGKRLQEIVHGEPEQPMALFTYKGKTKRGKDEK